MRNLALAVATLGACTTSYSAPSIDLSASTPIGVGLRYRAEVTQTVCDGGIDGDCGPSYPNVLTATATGAVGVVAAVPFDGASASVTIAGLAAGSGALTLAAGPGLAQTFDVAVAPVTATTMVVEQRSGDPSNGVVFPDATSPVQAFASSHVAITQRNLAADGTPLLGDAPLLVELGTTSIHYDPPYAAFATGPDLGTAIMRAPLAALELDVVDATAIAQFTLGGHTPATAIRIGPGPETTELYLLPFDANGRPIVGRGPDPIDNLDGTPLPTVGTDSMRSIVLTPTGVTTQLDITWGGVREVFTIQSVL